MRFQEKICIANWKLNKTLSESRKFCQELAPFLKSNKIWIAPSLCNLSPLIQEFPQMTFGAQKVSKFSQGAYTGEVSGAMLRDLGVKFCLCGHSERRRHFHETDRDIASQLAELLKQGITPVLCIGETKEEHEKGMTEAVLTSQIQEGLILLGSHPVTLLIAYEPVFAVGTKEPLSADRVQKILALIANKVSKIHPHVTLTCLYGGSVDPSNIDEYLMQPAIGGVLVGSASLDMTTFKQMINP